MQHMPGGARRCHVGWTMCGYEYKGSMTSLFYDDDIDFLGTSCQVSS